MKRIRFFMSLVPIFILVASSLGAKSAAAASVSQAQQAPQSPAPRVVDLKASDGTLLKASYFAAAKPGPGVLLLHQFNRTRKAWDDLAGQLAAAGINTLTVDMRGFGESGGTPNTKLTDAERAKVRTMRPSDIDTAFQYLVSQVRASVCGANCGGCCRSKRSARAHGR